MPPRPAAWARFMIRSGTDAVAVFICQKTIHLFLTFKRRGRRSILGIRSLAASKPISIGSSLLIRCVISLQITLSPVERHNASPDAPPQVSLDAPPDWAVICSTSLVSPEAPLGNIQALRFGERTSPVPTGAAASSPRSTQAIWINGQG